MRFSYIVVAPDGQLTHVHARPHHPHANAGPATVDGASFARIALDMPHLAAWATTDPRAPANLIGMLLVAALGDTIVAIRGSLFLTGLYRGQIIAVTDDDVEVVASLCQAAIEAMTAIGSRP